MVAKKKKEVKGKHKLPPKKVFIIGQSKNHPSMYRIYFEEGGSIPKELSADYTSKRFAQSAIDSYETKNQTYLKHVRDKEYAQSKEEDRE